MEVGGSTLSLLLFRELGSSVFSRRRVFQQETSPYFEKQMQRILIKSRAASGYNKSEEQSEPNHQSLENLLACKKTTIKKVPRGKKPKQNNNSSATKWTSFSSDIGVKLLLTFLDDKFILRSSSPDNVTQATLYKVFSYAYTPSKFFPLRLQYSFQEGEKKQWASYTLWCLPNHCALQMEKQRLATTLIALHKPSQGVQKQQKLCFYNFNNGKSINKDAVVQLVHDGRTTYSKLDVYHGEGTLICTSTKSSWDKDTVGHFLIFKTPRFTIEYHLQVKKSAVDKSVYETEIIGQYFIMKHRTSLEICSLEETILQTEMLNPNAVRRFVSHELVTKPDVLWKVNTADGYIDLQENISPSIFITKTKHSFKVNFPNEVQDIDKSLPTEEDIHYLTVKFFPDEEVLTVPVSVIHGSNSTGYQIYALKEGEECHSLQKIFPKPMVASENVAVSDDSLTPSNYRGLRVRTARRTYAEKTYEVQGLDYNENLELFAVAKLNKSRLLVSLYDRYTMDIFIELEPVKLRSKDRFMDDDCKLVIVDLRANFVSVLFELDTDKRRRIYCLGLTDECAKEML